MRDEKPDGREMRISEVTIEITKLMLELPHISDDEFLVAILRMAPRLVKRPRRKSKPKDGS